MPKGERASVRSGRINPRRLRGINTPAALRRRTADAIRRHDRAVEQSIARDIRIAARCARSEASLTPTRDSHANNVESTSTTIATPVLADKNSECPVCYVDASLIPCEICKNGVCKVCYLRLAKCPICRAPLDNVPVLAHDEEDGRVRSFFERFVRSDRLVRDIRSISQPRPRPRHSTPELEYHNDVYHAYLNMVHAQMITERNALHYLGRVPIPEGATDDEILDALNGAASDRVAMY